MPLIALLGVLATYFITGKALKPVKNLGDAMAAIDENNLGARVAAGEQSKEVANLQNAFNSMLDKLENAFAAQKNFAAAAAHELRTPLACMQANMEVLKLGGTPTAEEYEAAFAVNCRNTDRLIRLVDGLLQLQSGAEDVKERVSLHALVSQAFEELAPEEATKRLGLFLRGEANVWGNSLLLYRAFFNLVQNAVKYGHPGGLIDVRIVNGRKALRAFVADNGPGIPKDDLPHIFDAFYRVDKSRSRAVGGSGLGLSITKSVLQKQGAKIFVKSKQGAGTVFMVVFKKK